MCLVNLESQNMLTRAVKISSDVSSFVSVEYDVQDGEYPSSIQSKKFHEAISGLGVALEAINPNGESYSIESDFSKIFGREIKNKYRYGGQAISHLQLLEPTLPDSEMFSFAPAQLASRNSDSKLESFFEREGEDINFPFLTSGVIGKYFDFKIDDLRSDAGGKSIIFHDRVNNKVDSYRSINKNFTFDDHILVRNDKLRATASQEFIASHDHCASDFQVATQTDYIDRFAKDGYPMGQLLRSPYKADSNLKDSVLPLQTDPDTLSVFLTKEPASTGLQWSRRENVDTVMMEGKKTAIHSQESSTTLIPSDLSDLNLLKSISQKVGGDQIIGSLTISKSNQGETMDVYIQAISNIPANQSLKVDLDKPEPILVISIEEKNVSPDVKFVSSSRELIDLMAQKQSYLRMIFDDFGIEGYDFLFQAGGNEMQNRQRHLNENIQLEKHSFICGECVDVDFEVTSGIDKRI